MARNQAKDKAQLINRLGEVRVVEIACKQVGVSRATFYRWCNEDNEFNVSCIKAREMGTDLVSDMAESQIINKIKKGDFRASTYWLEHHHDEYKIRSRQDNPSEMEGLSRFTNEEIMQMFSVESYEKMHQYAYDKIDEQKKKIIELEDKLSKSKMSD